MDRDEFERIKQEEKEHLRTKKRLEKTLQTLQNRRRVRDTVTAMSRSASALLRETEGLVRSLSADAARSEARLELALDEIEEIEAVEHPDTPSDPPMPSTEAESEADDIESRAEQIVQQMKMASGPQHRRRDGERRRTTEERPSHPLETESTRQTRRSDHAAEDEKTSESEDSQGAPPTTLPEKTIGRMEDTATEDAPADRDAADGSMSPESS
jgi:hypothetical protein